MALEKRWHEATTNRLVNGIVLVQLYENIGQPARAERVLAADHDEPDPLVVHGLLDRPHLRVREGVARDVVQAHGGVIDLASEVGKGTTVRVELPAWKTNAASGVVEAAPG